MDTSELTMVITYNLEMDKFTYSGTVKQKLVRDLVSDFLRLQMGKGADNRLPNETNEYTIHLGIDLSFDHFTCMDNCGNNSLRDGILIRFLKWSNHAIL